MNNSKETKDNYHTMDELYDHRTVLFAIVCRQNKTKAWKSLRHSDGSFEEGCRIRYSIWTSYIPPKN